jgi:phage portal protein BeeE
MGLLDRVAAQRAITGRVVDRKSAELTGYEDPPFWDLDRLRFPMFGSTTAGSEREQIETDFEGYVEGIYRRNGAVAALMFVRQMVFSEARFQWRQMRNGRPGALFGTTDLALLETPWPNGTTGDLLTRMMADADLAGNAYFTVVNGYVRRLRPDWVTIVTGSRTAPELFGAAIDAELLGYIYSPPGGDDLLLPAGKVAHFAPIPDPLANWRGMSWLTPVLREISSDSAATLHKWKFFENGISPQVVVSLDASTKPESFERFMAIMDEQHKGVENAYKTIYLGGGANAEVLGADMKQLDFKATQGAGESRLAAAAGVPPVIVGFSEGLQGSSLNAGNYSASRRRFADGTLRPLWRQAAGSLATLLPPQNGAVLWYDDRDIAFLREDRKDAAEIQGTEARSIRTLLDAGFTADSVTAAVIAQDWTLLQHTGLFSVQLQPPGTALPKPSDDPPALPAGSE